MIWLSIYILPDDDISLKLLLPSLITNSCLFPAEIWKKKWLLILYNINGWYYYLQMYLD